MEDHNLYESIVETMNAGLAMIDNESRFTLVNNRFCRMVGYTRDELMGRSTFELFDRKDRDLVAEQLQRRRKGEDQSYEVAWLHKDGRMVPTINSPTPMFDDTGAYKGAVVTITEVTDVERLEHALAESEERFHSLVDLMPDAVLVRQGQNIAFANPAASKLFGAETPDDLIGKDILDFLHPEEHPKFLERRRLFERNGKRTQRSELKRLRLDGSMFFGEAVVGSMDWGGEPATIVVIRDTPESRRAAAALRESEERNRRLIEALPIAVMVRCGEEVVFVNQAAVAQMGATSADELIGSQALDWVHADDRDLVVARRKELERTGTQQFANVKMQRRDGTVFYSSNVLAQFVWE
ncbi:MAG: PAS domain S-box protein, partial [Proteobacteria bacterium]|nr:PAS domain S-box protein [Pseudomonadota bacterium]